ncbi:MAG: hypothetical protein ABR599_05870 [Gemmatimonadota bacterium]
MAVSPFARDLELFVRCKSCGFPVATGLRRRPGEADAGAEQAREHRCPRCGENRPYAAGDYARLDEMRDQERTREAPALPGAVSDSGSRG